MEKKRRNRKLCGKRPTRFKLMLYARATPLSKIIRPLKIEQIQSICCCASFTVSYIFFLFKKTSMKKWKEQLQQFTIIQSTIIMNAHNYVLLSVFFLLSCFSLSLFDFLYSKSYCVFLHVGW